MDPITRPSLLIRIRNLQDTEAWAEFHNVYAPLLYRYARARGLDHDDAEDIRSTCYETIVRQIATFDYNKEKGGFKAWLRTLADRRVIDRLRKRREQVAESHDLRELESDEPNAMALWEQQWRQQHLLYCIELARQRVSEQTFEVFRLLVNEERPVDDVCQQLQMTRNQVYKARSRILEIIREEMLPFAS
jgi:RNA polymerase sigma-70 factor (ECF subfamily)